MTVSTTINKITYNADGSTVAWTFPFPAVDKANLQVFITDSVGNVVQLNPVQYSVVLNPPIDPNPTSIGGAVNFPITGPPLAIGSQITILRQLPATQSTSLSNQSIIYPPVVEEEFDYLTLLDQQGTDLLTRAFVVPVSDPVPAPVPSVALRKNQGAFFDANGNLTAGTFAGGGAIISAAMQPVVAAATLDQARALMGVAVPTLQVTTTYVVTQANNRQVLNLVGAAFYTVSLGAASGYSNTFWVILFNGDTRGKSISIPGHASFILWPTQWVWVFQDGTGTSWLVTNPGRWQSDTAINFFVNPTTGSDNNDGLATTGAFQTIQHAVNIVQSHGDGSFTINLANGTYNVGSGVVCSQQVVGADGFNIIGNVATPLNVIIQATNGGNCFFALDAAILNVQGVTVSAVSGSANGFITARGAVLNIGNYVVGNLGPNGRATFAESNSTINITATWYIAAGATAFSFMGAYINGFVLHQPSSVTILGGVNCVGAFVESYLNSTVSIAPCTFVNSGLVSGPQFSASYNSTIAIGGSVIPGTSTGIINTGSWLI